MAVRYAMPIVGGGVYGSPIRPKYDCEGRDIHINYVLADGVAVVALKGSEAPSWANEPDVTRYDVVPDVPDLEVLQYLPEGMHPVPVEEVDETHSPLAGVDSVDPELTGPSDGGEDP
jgi:hypothetical protein